MELTKDLKMLYPFEGKFFDLGRHKMHYVDEGQGEVIVMVHGNPTWSFFYRNLIRSLSKHYRVIVPDHIGCGLSDKPQGYKYTLKQRIDDLGCLLAGLGVQNYSMIVHDWGGAIGLGHAVNCPEKLEKLVLLNTAAFRSQEIPLSISLCKNRFFGAFLVKYLNAFCFPATFMTTKQKLPALVKKGYLFPYDSARNRIAISEFVQDIPLSEEHRSYKTLKDIEAKLSLLTAKKLIIWGGKDFCFNKRFFDRWTKIYPQAQTFYFKNAGHYVLEDKPEESLAAINDFMRS
jgi:haloalkane dehalogenase